MKTDFNFLRTCKGCGLISELWVVETRQDEGAYVVEWVCPNCKKINEDEV